jgi:hypothetical protein
MVFGAFAAAPAAVDALYSVGRWRAAGNEGMI